MKNKIQISSYQCNTNYIYITINPDDIDLLPDWMQNEYNGRYYFYLNDITSKKFINWYSYNYNIVDISPCLLNVIKNFKMNQQDYIYSNLIIQEVDSSRPLKDYQIEAVKRMMEYKLYGFFYGTGTGKTLIYCSFLKTYLTENKNNLNLLNNILIVTTAKVIKQIEKELSEVLPIEFREKIVVTNYEQLAKITSIQFDTVIFDESHKIKNMSSNMHKYAVQVGKNSLRKYIFTGTPQDKNRHEVLAQIKVLNPDLVWNKTTFITYFFQLDDYYKPCREKKIHSEEITSIINAYTYGVKSEEVLQLTKEYDHIVQVAKPKIYDKLVSDRVLLFPHDWACVAGNKAVLRIKCRELCSGHLNIEKDSFVKSIRDRASPKYFALLDTLDSVNYGLIGYVFDTDLFFIESALKTKNFNYKCINGSTPKKEIESIKEDFKQKKYNFLVIQVQAGAEGLDFPYVNNIIFYTLPESYIQFHQFKSRIRRIGQTKELHYYYLLCTDTVDEQIYHTLKRKKSFTNNLFKIYK